MAVTHEKSSVKPGVRLGQPEVSKQIQKNRYCKQQWSHQGSPAMVGYF